MNYLLHSISIIGKQAVHFLQIFKRCTDVIVPVYQRFFEFQIQDFIFLKKISIITLTIHYLIRVI